MENYDRGARSWKLIHDERFMSAKHRRKLGMDTFETADWLQEECEINGDSDDRL